MDKSKFREKVFDHKSDYEDVEIDGFECKLRPMTVSQAERFQEEQLKQDGKSELRMVIEIVVENLVDKNFEDVFEEKEVDKIMDMPVSGLPTTLTSAFEKVNGDVEGDFDLEQGEGNKKK